MSDHDLVPGHVHEELRQEVVRLRSALAAVQWVLTKDFDWACPWCQCTRKDGHTDDCQRQAALGAGR
jgi:hypothetical protein